MAQSSKNIIVGAAALFVSYGYGQNRPTVDGTASTSGNINFNASANSAATQLRANDAYWRDLGFTNNGLEISYEPSYSDVMVDQLLDAARLFKQSIKVTLKTELSEATLENLHLTMGQMETYATYSGSTASTTNTFSYDSTNSFARLNLAAGSLGDAPVDRSLVAVGNAPRGLIGKTKAPSSTSSSAGAGASATINGNTTVERVYVARRLTQVDTTAHSLKRDAVTVFPVSFRCLPDTDLDAADGSEYGFIVDRVYA